MHRFIPKGRRVGVNMWTSAAGNGLTYPPFTARAAEDISPGGWDVVDVLRDSDGARISVYAFSVYIGKDGGRG